MNVEEREESRSYLHAAKGCLYLHMTLQKFQDQATDITATNLLQKAIYEEIVRNLELVVNPQSSEQKRGESISGLPVTKKLSISSQTDHDSRQILPYRAIKPPAGKTSRPTSRDEFRLAILCVLPLEYKAVSFLFDEFWDDDYRSADGDPNKYTTGRIGRFNVVLVLLPNVGKVSAASTSACLRSSFPGVILVFVTGICSAVPNPGTDEELLLDDVVIGKNIAQYDLGRQYPDRFAMRDNVGDALGRPPKKLRNLLAIFETVIGRGRLERTIATYLQEIQKKSAGGKHPSEAKYQYPGALQDKLFQASYRHKHYLSPHCICKEGHEGELSMSVCEESRQLSCKELGCDDEHLLWRERIEEKRQLENEGRSSEAQAPSIFVGSIGSGDTAINSGEHRDMIAETHDLLAFESEAAGVWDEFPCCIVVKAACDYADSHRNDIWQDFAAATAASATKALLERYFNSNALC